MRPSAPTAAEQAEVSARLRHLGGEPGDGSGGSSSGGSSSGGSGGGSSSGGESVDVPEGSIPPPPTIDPSDDPIQQAIEQIEYYNVVVNVSNQTFEDNDTTVIDDRDTTVDNSVNQNIEAFGDVNQDFDNDIVSGDGAVAAGDGADQHRAGAGRPAATSPTPRSPPRRAGS